MILVMIVSYEFEKQMGTGLKKGNAYVRMTSKSSKALSKNSTKHFAANRFKMAPY